MSDRGTSGSGGSPSGPGRGPFGQRGRGGPFGGHMGLGLPVEKPKNLKASLRRLAGYLRPRLAQLIVVPS